MSSTWQRWLDRIRPKSYGRKQPLILLNGLAEQAESWYRNRRFLSRFFDLGVPNILAFQGDHLHQRIDAKLPISVDYLVGELHDYLMRFFQRPPYHLVASSLGGKVAVEYAHRYPEMVSRMVLLCPSGMGDEEQLPFMEGVRRNDFKSVVGGVFYRRRAANRDMMRYYQKCFPNRRWRTGLLRSMRGTMDHTVRKRLTEIPHPTLLVAGEHDKIVDPVTAKEAVKELPHGKFVLIKKCGHAPQIEKPRYINRLVVHFLSHPEPTASTRRLTTP